MTRRPGAARTLALCAVLTVAGFVDAAAPAVSLGDPALPRIARKIGVGEALRVDEVVLEHGVPPSSLELERFAVFAPGATVRVHGDGGVQVLPPPPLVHLRGRVSDRPTSRAALTVLEDGALRGLVTDGGRSWMVAVPPGAAQPRVEEVTGHPALSDPRRALACGTDLLPAAGAGVQPPAAPAAPRSGRSSASYTARVAIETDHEYYQLFGDVPSALAYAADLVAYASGTFTTEVGTDLRIASISLWTAPTDPWTQASSLCALAEFARYWNENNASIRRTFAHFLSGRSAGGGIAWVGVLCSPGFDVDISSWGCSLSPPVGAYGGGYSFSGNLSGSFNSGNPGVVWDIFVASHEIGHNFSSPHTHCFDPPVDECWGSDAGCYSGPTSLPCPDPGTGCGTIMSYCHLQSPGVSNIGLTFGLGHPWGTDPDRVPSGMSGYVAATAASDPPCLAPVVFNDGFELGDTGGWSAMMP